MFNFVILAKILLLCAHITVSKYILGEFKSINFDICTIKQFYTSWNICFIEGNLQEVIK